MGDLTSGYSATEMRVRVLGARGSIPTHGAEYSRYGGATSSYLVEAGQRMVFVDAGTGILSVPASAVSGRKLTLFLTHPHMDHLIGLPFFPALNDPTCVIRICGIERAGLDVQEQIDGLFCEPYWPCRISEYPAKVEYHTLSYQQLFNGIRVSDLSPAKAEEVAEGDLFLRGMEVPHPGGCLAYRIESGPEVLTIATDAELPEPPEERGALTADSGLSSPGSVFSARDFLGFLCGTDLFLCDSQYTEEEASLKQGYGHSTVSRAVSWKEAAGAGRLALVHHDPKHPDTFLEEMVSASGQRDILIAGAGDVFSIREFVKLSGSVKHPAPEAAAAEGSDRQEAPNAGENRTEYGSYLERMTNIRKLSSPQLIWTDRAENYSDRLRGNFRRIGELAGRNREFLDSRIFPLTRSEDMLDEDTVREISRFMDGLVNIDTVENLDISIMSLLSDRLMKDAELKGDEEYIVSQLDSRILTCIIFVYMTSRIVTNEELSSAFRRQGLILADRILGYLEPEKFSALSDKGREHVLMSARRYTALYGSVAGITPETAHQWVTGLDRALAICSDPAYTELMPEFDWEYYRFRTLEQYSGVLDYMFETRPYPEDSARIRDCLAMQNRMWEEHPQTCGEYAAHDFVLLSLNQARYYAGELSLDEYRREVLGLYQARNRQMYDFDNLYVNLRSPFDYLMTFDPGAMTEEERALLKRFYRSVCSYAFRMQGGGTLGELLEYLTPVLAFFIEQPGEITLEEMGLQLLAALHPPTYVHSMTVANLTRTLCGALLRHAPEHLIGVCGTKSPEEVRASADSILGYAYHAALCHDFGKIPLIDTIFVYGRNLLDSEFNVIRQHPDLGAFFMERCASTRPYADVARGHHRWYNDQGGYPQTFVTADSPVKGIIDIVTVADCLDAATDTIGRSYSRGKTLEEFIGELREGSGTRYAPYVAELFEDEAVRRELVWLLDTGRANNYRSAYRLLRSVQEQDIRSGETNGREASEQEVGEIRSYMRGGVIFEEGAESDCMYEIRTGHVGIYKKNGTPEGQLLAELGEGDTFGEMGLIEGMPRSAAARAMDDGTQIVRITWPVLGEYFRENPSRIVQVMQQTSDRLRDTTKKQTAAAETLRRIGAALEQGADPASLRRILQTGGKA